MSHFYNVNVIVKAIEKNYDRTDFEKAFLE